VDIVRYIQSRGNVPRIRKNGKNIEIYVIG